MGGLIQVSETGLLVENTLFALAVAAYILATVGYLVNLFGKSEWGGFASNVLRVGLLIHTAFIITRTVNVQRVPFVGHFEFGNMFIWASVLVYIWTEWRLKDKYYAVGAFLTPLVVVYIAYLTVIPDIIAKVTISRAHNPLPPVLQSNWLKLHVSSSVMGYAGFTLAFAAAIMWLLKYYLDNKSTLAKRLPDAKTLEEYMYRAAVFGFIFQTVMIISGAIWADTSWGRYWGWDPKEMWSLITWFVFAVYLHARFTRGWTGMRTVALVMVGWVAMVFTWVGVAWLLSGIHSFG
ncbi:MAG: c-type cytochrome biogenesis protein CcsB [Bacillota bacterium]|nr:c-type cytochrome biogenesis protein CcsB [Bacillota bacterium]MDW7685121.1 c-type cytochrome biogenesis protein CcsB [Bacillota bacterium]